MRWDKAPIIERVAVFIKFYFTKVSNTRRDIDNHAKCVLDALQRCGVLRNDQQVDRLLLERGRARGRSNTFYVAVYAYDE